MYFVGEMVKIISIKEVEETINRLSIAFGKPMDMPDIEIGEVGRIVAVQPCTVPLYEVVFPNSTVICDDNMIVHSGVIN